MVKVQTINLERSVAYSFHAMTQLGTGTRQMQYLLSRMHLSENIRF